MQTCFTVETKRVNGNLYVEARGDLDGSSAMQLLNILHAKYDGAGKVYIETQHLRDMSPFGCNTFRCRLDKNRLPVDRLYFRGDKGRRLAPVGSTVIFAPPEHRCQCNGNCRNCPCAKGKNA